MKHKSSKNKPKSRNRSTVLSEVVDDMRQLYEDPQSSGVLDGWKELKRPDDKSRGFARIRDGVRKGVAVIHHEPGESNFTVFNEAVNDEAVRGWGLSASKQFNKIMIKEGETYPGIPGLRNGCTALYYRNGRMQLWDQYFEYQESGRFTTSEGIHTASADRFFNAPEGQLFTAERTYTVEKGHFPHSAVITGSMLPAGLNEGKREIVVGVRFAPLVRPESGPPERTIVFGALPLQLSVENIAALIQRKVEEITGN